MFALPSYPKVVNVIMDFFEVYVNLSQNSIYRNPSLKIAMKL